MSDRPNPDHVFDVPLWECPCRRCTAFDWFALPVDDPRSLSAFQRERFPEHYG